MSSEVGSGHVSIFPVMTGFKKSVTKELNAAGVAGKQSFSGGFKGAGSQVGASLGKDMKSSFVSGAGDLAGASLSKLQGDVAKASRAMTTARLSQQDSAGKVRVAEAQLAAAMQKYPAGAAQIVAAEERVASARRKAQVASDNLSSASARLKSAQGAISAVQNVATAEVSRFAGVQALAAAGVSKLSGSVVNLGRSMVGGVIPSLSEFRLGFMSSAAAASEFTGKMGTMGGNVRAIIDTKLVQPMGKVGGKILGSFGEMATGLSAKMPGWVSPAAAALGSVASKALPGIQAGVSAIGSHLSSGLSSAFSSAVSMASSAASSIGNAIRGASTIVGASMAVIGAGLASFVPEAASASDATDKFKQTLDFAGLDNSKIDELSKSTRKYADETVYSLSDIQGVTAQLAANGVKGYDTLAMAAGNLNSVAGGNADTFRSVGLVLTQTAGAGKLTTENWNQLSNAIPGASGKLQEAMKANGAFTGNFRDAMAKGEVTAEEFNKAISDLGMTDAAQEAATATKTFEGAIGAFKASIVGGLSDSMAGIKPIFTGTLTALAAAATPLFNILAQLTEKIGAYLAPAVEKLSAWAGSLGDRFTGLNGAVGPLAGVLAAMSAGALSPLLGTIGKLIPGIGRLSGAFSFLGGPIGIAISAFAGFALAGADVGEFVGGATSMIQSLTTMIPSLVSKIAGVAVELVSSLVSALPGFLNAGTQIIGALVEGITIMVPMLVPIITGLVTSLVQTITDILPRIVEAIPPLVTAIVSAIPPLVTTIIEALVGMLPALIQGAITLLMGIVQAITLIIPPLVAAIPPLITSLVQALVTALPMLLDGAVQLLLGIVQAVGQIIPPLLAAIPMLIGSLVSALIGMIPTLLESGIQLLLGLVQGLITALPQLVAAAITLIVQLTTSLIEMLPQLVIAGIQILVSLITGLIGAIPQLVRALPQIFTAIKQGFSDVNWGEVGSQLIDGIKSGIVNAAHRVVDAAKEAAQKALDGVKNLLGIHSPSRVFRDQVGSMISDGMALGIEMRGQSVIDAARKVAAETSRQAQAAASDVLRFSGSGQSTGGVAVPAGRQVNYGGVNIHTNDAAAVWAELQLKERLGVGVS